MQPTHLSFSQVNSLRSCGEMYRLERVEKVPQRPSCPAVAGRVIHAATETVDKILHDSAHPDIIHKAEPQHVLTVALAVAEVELEKEIASHAESYPDIDSWKRYGRATVEKPRGEDIDWFAKVGIPTSIRSYLDWRLATPDLTLLEIDGFGPAIEVPFDTYIGGRHVRGYIDRVFKSTEHDVPYLLDIKSGLKPKTDEQLGTYRKALREGAGLDVRWGGYLYGLKKGTAVLTPPIDLAHWTDEKLEQLYVQSAKLIDQSIFIPHPGEQCFRCGVSDHCGFLQAAI